MTLNFRYSTVVAAFLLILMIMPAVSAVRGQELIDLRGKVYAKDSGIPLSGAHVLVVGTSLGTISGPDGGFRLRVGKLPVSLKVTHIGFEERLFVVDEKATGKDLMLGMEFSAEMLDAVTITERKAELIFRDDSYAVLDFEFHENGLIMLIFRNVLKRAELILLSNLNDTLAILGDLPGRAQSLHRDCMGNIHFLNKDTAYQVLFTGQALRLLYPTSINTFKLVADVFVAFHQHYYYFGIRRMNDLMIEYIRYDSISGEYAVFRKVSDRSKLQILKDNPMHYALLSNPVGGRETQESLIAGMFASIEEQSDMLYKERDASVEGHYLRTLVYTPVYAPLFRSGDQLLLFNHPESRIETLSLDGELIRSVAIDYHKMKDWEETILKDDIYGEYYITFIKANRATLYRIDMNTGKPGPSTTLFHRSTGKILVHNGYVYYTYREPGSADRMMLYRQKLQR